VIRERDVAGRALLSARARLPRGRVSRAPEPWILAVIAGALSALVLVVLPTGTDFAAHEFQRHFFIAHPFSLWNNLWYGGRYSFVTYSLLYYPLAAVAGIRVLAVLSMAIAVLGLALAVGQRWGRSGRWASRTFAIVSPLYLMTAGFPFALAAAFGAFAVLATRRPRWGIFLVLSALTAAASPLAFLLLALVVLAIGLGERRPRSWLWPALGVLGGITAVELVLNAVFASGARNPFPVRMLVEAALFCAVISALTWPVPGARTARWLGIILGVACLIAFLVPSSLGEGVARFRFAALPLAVLALSLRRWRPAFLSVAVIALAGVWHLGPLVSAVANGAQDPSGRPEYWRPAVQFLRSHVTPGYRVEAVDTERHWAANYLPEAGIPLARGWFRQDDFPQNAPLYRTLSAAGYQRWLRQMAVRYVVLTDAEPDYTAHGEAALLRSGRSGLRQVLSAPHITIFEVLKPRALVAGSGHAQVVALAHDRLVLRATPGDYRVAIRFSPYWQASTGCLRAGRDGMLRLTVHTTGTVVLRFHVGLDRVVDQLVGDRPACAGR
jgi:hypothetical protein